MLKGVNPSCVYDFSDHHFSGIAAAAEYNDRVDDAIYGSDEFRMYAYKIKRCPRMRSHDWTECPYAHRGEKAQRRDPRKFNYSAIVCPAFRNGASCSKGDTCEFAHGVFEYWLHPARYRTRACNSGQLCQRKVCFFAHSPEQLRPETKSKRHSHYAYRPTAVAREPVEVVLNGCGDHVIKAGRTAENINMNGADGATSSPYFAKNNDNYIDDHGDYGHDDYNDSFQKFADFLKSLRALKIRDMGGDGGGRIMSSGLDVSESDLPHVEWISKLVQ
ncbi:zinc finger CCCH domain-containing protein 54 [Humulus lupulus]|uniref:zinc finger CCCH domain-containing protein 54 n=1 Tax=Humulus lupulus TaxID=3486 RepID=UPI002B40C1E7|nr:zinc finger CCCH domain-containing protein 54 [Humulus lupulus]